jgi:hypothetical protein
MRRSLLQSLCALGVLFLTGASQAGAPSAAPAGGDIIQPGTPRETSKKLRQLPPDVQQDPGARVMRLQHIRRAIVQRVKRLDEGRYRNVVRPDLARQLGQLGFDDQDVTYFLTDLDRARGAR